MGKPTRVYMIGFGGGRIPMVLHHYFPEVIIESTDIDPDIPLLAKRYFGIELDQRQRVIIQDGREYLASRPESTLYDIIAVDAFRGTGYHPYHLATTGFYNLCKRHLVDGGVVSTNLVESDPLFLQKIKTMRASFEHTYLFVGEGAHVLFGTNAAKLSRSELIERAKSLQEQHGFQFPLLDRAQKLKAGFEIDDYLTQFGTTQEILTDESPPPGLLESVPATDAIFFKVERNDPCPCGSGKKFKHCHGRK